MKNEDALGIGENLRGIVVVVVVNVVVDVVMY